MNNRFKLRSTSADEQRTKFGVRPPRDIRTSFVPPRSKKLKLTVEPREHRPARVPPPSPTRRRVVAQVVSEDQAVSLSLSPRSGLTPDATPPLLPPPVLPRPASLFMGSMEGAATVTDSQLHYSPINQSLQEVGPAPEVAGFLCDVESVKITSGEYFLSYPNFQLFEHKALAMKTILQERRGSAAARCFVPLWGKQTTKEGSQSFVVASVTRFWSVYLSILPSERVFYEMIQSDSLVKCFTDYDSSIEDMTSEQFEENVKLLNNVVKERLESVFNVRSSVLVLSSSSQKKHSKHCIWTSGNAMFASIHHLKVRKPEKVVVCF
jgi:hypothetical protein